MSKTNRTKTGKTTSATTTTSNSSDDETVWQDGDELRWAARHLAARLGVKTPVIQLRQMTTKWGSISTAGRLTLNTDLLTLPKPLGEFVIVHELVHLLAPNHGRVFKSFMHAYLPDWQVRERELRRHGGGRADSGTVNTKRPIHLKRATRRARARTPRRGIAPSAVDPAPSEAGKSGPGAPRTRETRGRAGASDPPQHKTDIRALGNEPSVLIVDDDPSVRFLLRELLTLEGRAVQVAEHGGPALRHLRASAKNMIVLLGLMMPQVDGEALLEAVAANRALAERHVFVMVTAALPRATSGRVAELRERLDIPLVAKPFAVNQILDAVDAAAQRLTTRAQATMAQG